MRGVIESYDSTSFRGTIAANDGRKYDFSRTSLTRRSKEPRPEAKIVFRQRQGRVVKARVVSYQRQWEWVAVVAEVLLYLPLVLAK